MVRIYTIIASMLIMAGFIFGDGNDISISSAIDTQETTTTDKAKSYNYFTDTNKNGVDDRLEEKRTESLKEQTSDSEKSFLKRLINSTGKSKSRYSDRNTSHQKSEQSNSKKTVEKGEPSYRSSRHTTEKKDSGGKSYRTK